VLRRTSYKMVRGKKRRMGCDISGLSHHFRSDSAGGGGNRKGRREEEDFQGGSERPHMSIGYLYIDSTPIF